VPHPRCALCWCAILIKLVSLLLRAVQRGTVRVPADIGVALMHSFAKCDGICERRTHSHSSTSSTPQRHRAGTSGPRHILHLKPKERKVGLLHDVTIEFDRNRRVMKISLNFVCKLTCSCVRACVRACLLACVRACVRDMFVCLSVNMCAYLCVYVRARAHELDVCRLLTCERVGRLTRLCVGVTTHVSLSLCELVLIPSFASPRPTQRGPGRRQGGCK
jgi:hypothetical protein